MRAFLLGLVSARLALAALGDRNSIFELKQKAAAKSVQKRDTDPALLYPAYNFSVPTDHFKNDSRYEPHSDDSFNLRYWFDASHFQAGGPVIILQSGETSGTDRLPYLQKGLLQQLAQATNGIGVVLEHRYYGTSIPTPDLSTESLRFLTTEQALADEAYFSQNIVFPGLENVTLTSKDAAHITYGGSYAGSFVAFLRVLYPDVFWGAISSSGVPEAIVDYWQYYGAIAEHGPADCIAAQQNLIQIIDGNLIDAADNQTAELKSVFGLSGVAADDDFGNTVSVGMGNWQSLNWDPSVSSNAFYTYCSLITNSTLKYPSTSALTDRATALIEASGVTADGQNVTAFLNLIGYINQTAVAPCAASGQTQDECFNSRDSDFYSQDDISQDWRLWPYQYCTEWGFLQTGSGVPADQRPIISRAIDVPFSEVICNLAFNITSPPDVDRINRFGGYNISYNRLASINGESDPWRPAGTAAFEQGAPMRNSTTDEPFEIIPGAVHHWDENGVFPNQTSSTFPPSQIVSVQKDIIDFTKAWIAEYNRYKRFKRFSA